MGYLEIIVTVFQSFIILHQKSAQNTRCLLELTFSECLVFLAYMRKLKNARTNSYYSRVAMVEGNIVQIFESNVS